MENLVIKKTFWSGKRVFITGHTGFKGSWLTMWLLELGAEVTGYSQPAPTQPSLFELCDLQKRVTSIYGDVRDYASLLCSIQQASPEIVIHMAAQPLVRYSYQNPIETYATNVMGTVHLMEAVRQTKSVKAVVNVTTDKCYDNKEWLWGYREDDTLGGYDPYSNSKACSELVTASFRNSFFPIEEYDKHGVAIATARAGNVIGGGDWAKDRLVPDCLDAIMKEEDIILRNPNAIRPWQHVLEPLSGYLILAERLYTNGKEFSESWNFGPYDNDAKSVKWIVNKLINLYDKKINIDIRDSGNLHEAKYLKLDCSKSQTLLNWKPRWSLDTALEKIIEWIRAYKSEHNLYEVCKKQIEEYNRIH